MWLAGRLLIALYDVNQPLRIWHYKDGVSRHLEVQLRRLSLVHMNWFQFHKKASNPNMEKSGKTGSIEEDLFRSDDFGHDFPSEVANLFEIALFRSKAGAVVGWKPIKNSKSCSLMHEVRSYQEYRRGFVTPANLPTG